MTTTPTTLHESSAVHTHLTILQGVINRMNVNSRSCKTWCVTISAATFIIAARDDGEVSPLIALVAVAVLGGLDTYYLKLERAFRNSYDGFVAQLQHVNALPTDLFKVRPTKDRFSSSLACLRSRSIWLFYGALGAAALLLHFVPA